MVAVSLFNSSVWIVLMEDSVWRLILDCGGSTKVVYLVPAAVFDTMDSTRKYRRPVGAGMMLPPWLTHSFQ